MTGADEAVVVAVQGGCVPLGLVGQGLAQGVGGLIGAEEAFRPGQGRIHLRGGGGSVQGVQFGGDVLMGQDVVGIPPG